MTRSEYMFIKHVFMSKSAIAHHSGYLVDGGPSFTGIKTKRCLANLSPDDDTPTINMAAVNYYLTGIK